MKARFFNLLMFCNFVFASTGAELASNLHINPSTKAQIQWKKVFKKPHKMKKYGIDTLSPLQQQSLLDYLIQHAADSDEPMVPGF